MQRDAYDDKLERILREASVVFAEKGYHRASIREIAAATGISLSGLYYYFDSKEELLFLIQKHCFRTILERLRRDLEGVGDPEERLRILVRNHLRFFVANMAEMKVLSHEAESLTGEYREQVTEWMREYTRTAYDVLEELAPAGEGVDLRVATFSLFGMMNWIYNWYREDRDVDVERLACEMLHIFLRGYCTAPESASLEGAPVPPEASLWESR